MKVSQTYPMFRPVAEFGTLLYLWLLLLPVWPFKKIAQTQVFTCRAVYFKNEAGFRLKLTRKAILVGAVWDAHWRKDLRAGPDGKRLFVQTPQGPWFVDGRASNCTMKHDHKHRCWVRHGSPEEGTFQIDKNGHTCRAGAGSLRIGNYHARLVKNHLLRIPFF